MVDLDDERAKIEDRVRRAPSARAELQDRSGRGLSYELTLVPDPTGRRSLRDLIGDTPGLTVDRLEPSTFSVLQCRDRARIDTEASLYGSNVGYLVDSDGGMTFLDRTDKMFLRADADQLPPFRFEDRAPVNLRMLEGDAIEGRETRIARLEVKASKRVEYRLWLAPDAELEPYRELALRLIVGCPECLSRAGFPARELTEIGFPVRTEIRIHDDVEPLLVARIERLKLRRIASNAFEIPDEFLDLRNREEITALYPKGWTAPSVRASSFRRGYIRTKGGDIHPSDHDPHHRPDEPSRPPAGDTTDGSHIPQCLPSTFGSVVSLAVEQGLLDDVRFLANEVFRRLDSFEGKNGNITVDWLEQWRQHADPNPVSDRSQDGLWCLFMSKPGGGEQGGLLFRMATRQARRAMADGTIGSQIPMNPTLLFEVVSALGTQPPEERFDKLKPDDQARVRDLYLEERIGKLKLTYKQGTSPTKTFHDLMMIQLSALEFDVKIGRERALTVLDTTSSGEIFMHIDLPHVRGEANIGRWPTGLYFVALAAGGITCAFVPFLCSLGTMVALAGLFLLSDYATTEVNLDKLHIDATIKFIPDSKKVLRPDVATVLDADINVFYMSYIPTGLHQLVSLVYMIVGSHTDLVLDEIEGQLETSLNKLFEETLALRFPPSFGPVPLLGLNSNVNGAFRDFLYLGASLDAGASSLSPPYVTQVDPDVQPKLMERRTASTFDRRYAGFVISQNFINQFINSRWRDGAFNFEFIGADLADLVGKFAIALAGQRPQGFLHAHLWPAVSPRTVLTPLAQANNGPYATTFFDDLRLCLAVADAPIRILRMPDTVIELQFSAQAYTQVGFGGIDPVTRTLDIGRFAEGFMDLYFDLDTIGVQLIHPETWGMIVQGTGYAGFDPAIYATLEPALEFAVWSLLRSRSDTAIPVDAADRFVQRYPIPAASLDVHMFAQRGNLYGWLGLAGDSSSFPDAFKTMVPKGLVEIFAGGTLDLSQDLLDCNVSKLVLKAS
jgi:hypothetical protein